MRALGIMNSPIFFKWGSVPFSLIFCWGNTMVKLLVKFGAEQNIHHFSEHWPPGSGFSQFAAGGDVGDLSGREIGADEGPSLSCRCCSHLTETLLLVGGLEHEFYDVPVHILGRIIPTDFHIFQMGRSTTNQLLVCKEGELAGLWSSLPLTLFLSGPAT